jgi:hypothetical protein
MFSRVFSFLLLLSVIYLGTIFILPEIADTYGNKSWNDTVRALKSKIETDSGALSGRTPLIDRVNDIAKPYIDETKSVVGQVQTTIDTKTEQVKQASESVQKAYDALQ